MNQAQLKPFATASENSNPRPDSFNVLGVRVDVVQIPDVIEIIDDWIERRSKAHFVAVTGMHGISEARRDKSFRRILNDADLVVPDGMPLVWLGRIHGKPLRRRVYGPEMMTAFCHASVSKGRRHFLYGGAPGVVERLSDHLRAQCPGIKIVGTHCPPFHPLSPAEIREARDVIRASAPDILWVGLGTPKQERWMHEATHYLDVPAIVGVGAAFDFNSGRVRQAPLWMRENGLEWFFRLLQEPRRLWRRYLIQGPKFVFLVLLELTGLVTFDNGIEQSR